MSARPFGLTYYRRWNHGTTMVTPQGRYATEAAAFKRAALLFTQMGNLVSVIIFRTDHSSDRRLVRNVTRGDASLQEQS